MKKIKIFDTTLRDGEQSPGCSMNVEEKIQVAKKLEELNVDVIEAGFAASSNQDKEAIRRISKTISKPCIASLARCKKSDIDEAYEVLKEAKNCRIHIFIATSTIHMKDKLKMTQDEVLKNIANMVSYAKSKFKEVEFSCEDATRSDIDFLLKAINIAIKNGATIINIPDTVGYLMPQEFFCLVHSLKEHIPKNIELSVHCHNDLGQATANTMSAILAGADQIECTINGIGERAGNTPLEEVVAALKIKKDYFKAYTNINTAKIFETSQLLAKITNSLISRTKPIVGENAFKHESGIHQHGVINNKATYEILNPTDFGIYQNNIVIGLHSGRTAIIQKMQNFGLKIEDYYVEQIMEDIKEYLSFSKTISDEDILEIINRHKKEQIYILCKENNI